MIHDGLLNFPPYVFNLAISSNGIAYLGSKKLKKINVDKNLKKGKIVACLDMGSSKLVCIIASVSNGNVQILGYGHKESKGIIAGAISDMRLAEKSKTRKS